MLVFSLALVLIYFLPDAYSYFAPPETYSFSAFEKEISRFRASEKLRRTYSYKQLKNEVEEKELSAGYFEFDPNGLSESSWQKLGLSARQIKVIKNFENKGGHFYKKEDLQKIYSVTPEDYARLEPYISITPKENNKFKNTSLPYQRAAKPTILVELNAADSTSLETINGIGPAFAVRILKYRQRLGGYYNKNQLLEVYGLDSAKFNLLEQQVRVEAQNIQKININTALFEDLKQHPYLTYKQMNAIIQYRKQHGNYTTADDLKKIAIINEETIRKLSPYLSF